MDILNNIHIGDESIDDKGQVKIMDEDRLCFLVRAESRGAYGLRTISKQLLMEYVAYFSFIQTTTLIRHGKPLWQN